MNLTKKEKEIIVKSLNQYEKKILWRPSEDIGVTARGMIVKTIPFIETQRKQKEREWIKDLIKKIKKLEKKLSTK